MIGFNTPLEDEYPDEEIPVRMHGDAIQLDPSLPPPLVRDPEFDVLTTLQELQEYVVRDLLSRVRERTATHQELSLVVKLLKDNGITLLPVDLSPTIDQSGRRQAVPHMPPKSLPAFREEVPEQ